MILAILNIAKVSKTVRKLVNKSWGFLTVIFIVFIITVIVTLVIITITITFITVCDGDIFDMIIIINNVALLL